MIKSISWKILAVACALSAGSAGLVACGGGEPTNATGSESSSGSEDIDGASDESGAHAAYEGPVSGDAAVGGEIFATFCDGCHPGGEAGLGPSLLDHHESAAGAREVIREGDGRMPGFDSSQISDEDLENLLAHMQANFGMF